MTEVVKRWLEITGIHRIDDEQSGPQVVTFPPILINGTVRGTVKRVASILLIALVACWCSFAADITATKAGNWSDTTVWDLGRVPAAGDNVALAGYTIVWDAGAGTRIPATSGTLNSITSAGSAGAITLAINTIGTCNLWAATITAGTNTTGFIQVTGSASNTLTVHGNVTGGSAANAKCIAHNASGNTVAIAGNVTGGSASNTYGMLDGSSGSIMSVTGNISGGSAANAYGVGCLNATSASALTVTGNVTGGSNTQAYGIQFNSGGGVSISGNVTGGTGLLAMGVYQSNAGTATIAGHLIDGTGGVAWGGKPPVWINDGSKYHQVDTSGGTYKLGKEPAANQLLVGVVCGDVVGTRVPFLRGDR